MDLNGIMSEESDSDNDEYDYLAKLDNLSWTVNRETHSQRKWFPIALSDHDLRDNQNNQNNQNDQNDQNDQNNDNHVLKQSNGDNANGARKARPAVAKHVRPNRGENLLKSMAPTDPRVATTSSTAATAATDQTVKPNDRPNANIISSYHNAIHSRAGKRAEMEGNIDNNRSKRMRYSATNYDINSVLALKRQTRELAAEKSAAIEKSNDKHAKEFGKAFLPNTTTSSTATTSTYNPMAVPSIPSIPIIHANDESNSNDKYSQDSVLHLILEWNPFWLKECGPTEVPPPLCPYGEAKPLKLTYDTLEEYQSIYLPLILYETWAQIYDESKSRSKRMGRKNIIRAAISPDYSARNQFICLSLQTICPKKDYKSDNYPSEGDLISLELLVDENRDVVKMVVFGYVTDSSVEKVRAFSSVLPLLIPLANLQTDSNLITFEVRIIKRSLRLYTKELIDFKTNFYLKPTLRQIEALSSLRQSYITKDIIRPREFTCNISTPTVGQKQSAEIFKQYNESQYKAIVGSSEAINRPFAIPKILLIQGPPGTGKTHTLIGIIKHIYLSWDPKALPKILICAPSNGAVDEIARRLYIERHFLKKGLAKRSLRIVRVARQSSIVHPDVQKILLEKLIESNISDIELKHKSKESAKSQEIEKKIAKLDQDIADYRATNRKDEIDKAMHEMQNLAKELQRNGVALPDVNKRRTKQEIMLNADVVLCTLNSCHQSPIESLMKLKGSPPFSCVIVDEASQCCEPELLMPLIYKMTKMILIGDPMQLPATIISKRANDLKFGRSLFERFFKHFGEYSLNEEQKSPVLMLNKQYRMHPDICEFPSNQFYGARLMSSETLVEKRRFPLKSYIMFDLLDSLESQNDPSNRFNDLEANFVKKIVSVIDGILPQSVSVGVITPYQGQKKVLLEKFNDTNFNVQLDCNTVDGFQGQERDVIVLSCVRAFEKYQNHNSVGFLKSVQRMNVALTRAKYSLIVCTSARSLESDKNWKALIENAKTRNRFLRVSSTLTIDKIKKALLI